MPRGTSGQARRPTRSGLTACQMSTKGCPSTRTAPGQRAETASAIRDSFEPGTMWSTSTPARAVSVGPKTSRTSSRLSTPSSSWTAMPAAARSSPHTCWTSSASWRPSTQIRERLATVGALEAGAKDPELVIRRPEALSCTPGEAWAGFGLGGRASMGRPSSQKPGPRGKERRTPRRSSSSTR